MAQVMVVEPTIGGPPNCLLGKRTFTEFISVVEADAEGGFTAGEAETVERCEEMVSKALQLQSEIQDSIDHLREIETERLSLLLASIRSLEQSQTVVLLVLGMLNRRVLYEYPSLLAREDTGLDRQPDAAPLFSEEIALLRKALADVVGSEKRSAEKLTQNALQSNAAHNQLKGAASRFEDLTSICIGMIFPGEGSPSFDRMASNMRKALSNSDRRSLEMGELENGHLARLCDLGSPVWDACADIKEMCDLLEFNDFQEIKDEFLRKILTFASKTPRQWPQALNFRCEVKSDVRSNLGLDKYGELRWHID